MERRCLNCMKIFIVPEGYEDDDNCCPFCGFIENTTPKNVSYMRPGTLLQNRYSIGTVIGAGGFGITYKAWDNTLDTIVAIKEFFPQGVVLRDNTTSKTNTVSVYNVDDDSYEHGKERFIKEARSLAKFNSNPGTVVIYDFFEENDTAYIVMEYLDGCNMKEYVGATKSLPDFETLKAMVVSVCDVLTEVHSVGLIHRDISPDNIFMCLNGTFKLIDFGSVKQGLSDSTLSATVILKHGYAPFEQYSKSGKVGPWTDIYAFAATIYYLTTGIIPQESVERLDSDEIVHVCEINSLIPRAFGDAVMKALSPQIKNRYQTVEEFKKDLLREDTKIEESITSVEDVFESEEDISEPESRTISEETEDDDDDAPSKGPLFIGLALIAFICIFILIGVKEAVDKASENSNNNTTESRVETTENVESEYEGYTISPIVVNEYSRDTTTDKSKFSYGCSRLYFHFKVEATSSHESTPLIIRINYPDNKEVEEVKLSENLDGKYIHRRVELGNDVALKKGEYKVELLDYDTMYVIKAHLFTIE